VETVTCEPIPAEIKDHLEKAATVDPVENPWTKDCPSHQLWGPEELGFREKLAKVALEKTEYRWRTVSAVLVPFIPPTLIFASFSSHHSSSEGFWMLYGAASALLAAIFCLLHRHENEGAKAFGAELERWAESQRIRTSYRFWTNGILDQARQELRRKGTRNPTTRELNTEKGHQFALEIGRLFAGKNWNVRVNQKSYDYGVDVFACDATGKVVVVQCKHTTTGPGVGEVRELLGVMKALDPNAALLVSIELAASHNEIEYFWSKADGKMLIWHLGHIIQQATELFEDRVGLTLPTDRKLKNYFELDGRSPKKWRDRHSMAA
jgi:hypothetical protein